MNLKWPMIVLCLVCLTGCISVLERAATIEVVETPNAEGTVDVVATLPTADGSPAVVLAVPNAPPETGTVIGAATDMAIGVATHDWWRLATGLLTISNVLFVGTTVNERRKRKRADTG